MRFTSEPLHLLVRHLTEALAALPPGGVVTLEVPDPDLGRGRYPGERVGPQGALVHRPWRAWCDLAEALSCRLLTPRPVDGTHVQLRLEPLGPEAPWHADGQRAGAADGTVDGGGAPVPRAERYGTASPFARVRKLEDPGFLLPWAEALARVPLAAGDRVLDLGVNRGDELEALCWRPDAVPLEVWGVDHSESALAEARARFPGPGAPCLTGAHFLAADLARGLPPGLPRFELVLSVGTLQSPGLDGHALLRALVQEHLAPRAALVLGFPNSRFRDGEVLHGARVRNLREADLSLVVKDLSFYRRYLHQHGFRTYLTGKYDLLLTAVRLARAAGEGP
jgi:SAM-dependent methyltransferase